MFARNQNVKLVNTITQGDAKIVWKMFHNRWYFILSYYLLIIIHVEIFPTFSCMQTGGSM